MWLKRTGLWAGLVVVLAAAAAFGEDANLARGRACQVFSTDEVSGWTVGKLTDGQTRGIGWSSKAFKAMADHRLYPEYVIVDLGKSAELSRVVLYPRTDEGNIGKGFPQDFTVEACEEGEPWRAVVTKEDFPQPARGGAQSIELGGARGRFVKVAATRLRPVDDGGHRFQLAEIEVYGKPAVPAPLQAAPAPAIGAPLAPSTQPTLVGWLRCENRENPMGMDAPRPRLSWVVESTIPGQRQTAYRVLVATSPQKLAKDEGDAWDSGKVKSDQNIAVLYDGKPLESARTYAWKVMVWDKDDKPTAWNDQSTMFFTGYFKADDWQGQWIGASEDPKHRPVYLRKRIDVAKPVIRATAIFSGLGWSELTIEGQRVGDYVMGPGFTTYDKRTPYLVFDVTRHFSRPGPKTVGALLVDGWYGLSRDPWVHQFEKNRYVDKPKLRLDLRLEHEDGSTSVIGSDESWAWSFGPLTRSWICEADFDNRLAMPGWNRSKFDASAWKPVALASAPAGALQVQKEPLTRIVEEMRPIRCEYRPEMRDWVYTFSREFTGSVRFKTSGPAGTVVKIATQSSRENAPGIPVRTNTFTLAGSGTETFESRQTYTAIARVYVSGVPEAQIGDLTGLRMSGVGPICGGFACSNDLLNWMHGAARRTQENYVTFLPNDPSREFKAWMEDPVNMFRSAVYLFDSQAMYERWQWDMLDGQRADGDLPNIAPGAFFDAYNSPWWGGSAVWLPSQMETYYGDDTMLRNSYDAMRRYVDFLGTRAQDGMQNWGLGDWLAPEETPLPMVNTPAAFAWAKIASRTAHRIGHSAEGKQYQLLADQIAKQFNARYLDAATGIYGQAGGKPVLTAGAQHEEWWKGNRVCTQTGQALPLALGMTPPENRAAVEQALVREVAAHKDHVGSGFIGTPCVMETLADVDPQAGYRMTTQRDFPSWYAMTAGSDAEQMMETWNGGQAFMPSLGGNLVMWNMEALGGIRPDPAGPGFKRIVIKPNVVGDLHWVKSWFDSPRGRIVSNWRKRDKQLMMEVLVPANATATIFVPAMDAGAITESGRPAGKAPGLRFLRMEGGRAVYDAQSGSYRFASTLP